MLLSLSLSSSTLMVFQRHQSKIFVNKRFLNKFSKIIINKSLNNDQNNQKTIGHNLLSKQKVSTTATTKALERKNFQPTMTFPTILHQQPEIKDKTDKLPWKEASSLIILANNDDNDIEMKNEKVQSNFDYQLLMVKRSSSSSFFASAYVFPGGQVELSDFDSLWYKFFDECGISKNELNQISTNIVGPRPPIITDPLTLKTLPSYSNEDFIHLDLGLRISAIRETFEEAGILLLTDPKNRSEDYCSILTSKSLNIDLGEWQKNVRSDSKKFYELCDTLKMVPNVWALYEWSNWLTPVNVGHRRFDTIFYVCCFKNKPPVFVDNAEIIKPLWCNPIHILEEHQLEQVFLAPPQVYEVSRMLRFNELNKFQKFMKSRQALGTHRWLPVIYTYDDGAISTVPGDEQYPKKPDLIIGKPLEVDGSIEDINQTSKSMNRMELRGVRCRTLCNIEPGCGHLPPVTYPFDDNHVKPGAAKL